MSQTTSQTRTSQTPVTDFIRHHYRHFNAAALVDALRAGERAGGDLRGRQSAAVLVARTSDADESPAWPPQLALDLRSDDATDPLTELDRLVGLPGAVAPPA